MKAIVNKVKSFYKVIEHPTTAALVVTFLCYKSLIEMGAEYDKLLRILIIVTCYICTVSLSVKREAFGGIVRDKGAKVLFSILWLYFAFAVWGPWYLDSELVISANILVQYLLVALWTYPIIAMVAVIAEQAVSAIADTGDDYQKGLNLKTKLIFAGIIVIVSGIMLIAFNPAITSPDSAGCYQDAYKIILGQPIDNNHPFFYKFVLSLIMRINTSISFIITVQIVLYSLICIKSINLLRRMGVKLSVCTILFILSGISYNTVMQLVTLWKDVPYTISLLWLTVLLADFVVFPQRRKREMVIWYIELVIACAFVGFIRHGGLIPVFASLIVLFIASKEKKKVAIGIAAVIVTTILIRVPLYNALRVVDLNTTSKFNALAADIEYVYYNGGELNSEGEELVISLADGSPETYNYNAWYGASFILKMNDMKVIDFLRIYLNTLSHNPALMIKGILVRNNYLWTMVIPDKGEWSCVARMTETILPEDAVISYPPRKNNFLTDILFNGIAYISFVPAVNLFYWRIGIYTFLLLSAFMMITYKRKKLLLLVPFFPILMNCFVLVVACSWPNYRYYWPNAFVCGFLLLYTMLVISRKKYDTKNNKNWEG